MIDCIIPARSGSKGIPKKNIILLEKLPLIAYSIFVAKTSTQIKKVRIQNLPKFPKFRCREICEILGDFVF